MNKQDEMMLEVFGALFRALAPLAAEQRSRACRAALICLEGIEPEEESDGE